MAHIVPRDFRNKWKLILLIEYKIHIDLAKIARFFFFFQLRFNVGCWVVPRNLYQNYSVKFIGNGHSNTSISPMK